MTLRRTWGLALVAALSGISLLPACQRRKPVEVNPIIPSIKVNRPKAPLGSAIEVTYTWTLEPGAKKLDQDYNAFLHFLDSHRVMLFAESHLPDAAAQRLGAGQDLQLHADPLHAGLPLRGRRRGPPGPVPDPGPP